MNANLVLLAKSGKQKAIPLPSKVTVIGRRRNCDLRIPLESVSRRHCQISDENDQLTLRDLGSRNGTLLNGRKLNNEEVVKAGDYIQIGQALFALQVDGRPEKIASPPSEQQPLDPDDTAVLGDLADLDDSGGFPDLDEDEIDLDAL